MNFKYLTKITFFWSNNHFDTTKITILISAYKSENLSSDLIFVFLLEFYFNFCKSIMKLNTLMKHMLCFELLRFINHRIKHMILT